MLDDHQLLNRYVEDDSEAAFGEIVSRHVNLVYSAALRRTGGDAHAAQDVAQLVFTDLASKARSLPKDTVLAGWLHRATRYAAAQRCRTERRRQSREHEAAEMNALQSESAPHWEEIRPLLDEALDRLNRTDRDALLLRFFEQRSLAEVGQAIGSGEEAARKRVHRALEKLRADLVRRGLTTTAATLATTISANAVQLAPTGLAATLTNASVAGAAAGAGSTFAALKIVSMTKLQTAIASSILVASLATSLVVHNRFRAKLRDEDGKLERQRVQLASLESDQQRLLGFTSRTSNPAAGDTEELDKLRAELAPLRKQADELAALRQKEREQQAALDKISRELRVGVDTNWQRTANSVELDDKIHYAMSLTLAMHEYASKHDGRFPTNLEQTLEYFRPEDRGQTNLSPNQFEILFHGNGSDIAKYAHPDLIILVKERRPWTNIDGKPVMVWSDLHGAGYAYSPADGRFDQWEKQHTAPPESLP